LRGEAGLTDDLKAALGKALGEFKEQFKATEESAAS
jgi:hypothetical protein